MNLTIDDYRITADTTQWVLQRKTDSSHRMAKGKGSWKDVGFFNRLPHLMTFLLDRLVRDTPGELTARGIQNAYEGARALLERDARDVMRSVPSTCPVSGCTGRGEES